MSNLIEFTAARKWQDKVFIDPDDISFIERLSFDRDMGEYSSVTTKSGKTVEVFGLPSDIARKIIKSTSSKKKLEETKKIHEAINKWLTRQDGIEPLWADDFREMMKDDKDND